MSASFPSASSASSAPSAPSAVPALRGRIGRDARSGHYPVPHRYRLHLALSCPDGLQIAVTHSLLGLDDILPVTFLPALPDAGPDSYASLRPLYEATAHQYSGPAAAPVLSDSWSGRIVSTDPTEILTDLVRRFPGADLAPDLDPDGAAGSIQAVAQLCERAVDAHARRAGRSDADPAECAEALCGLLDGLAVLEARLSDHPYLLGDDLTLADVRLWTTLVQLDTVHRWHLDAAAVHRIAGHPHLWTYAGRLTAHPAFGRHLDLHAIACRHHAGCLGSEAAGAAIPILDWAAHAHEAHAVRS